MTSIDTLIVPSVAAAPPKLRVLFVEDNDYVRDLTICLLEGSDREVSAFGTAEEALEEFKNEPFDIVITDVSLPRMSGIELAKRLLALVPDMWIVFASGYKLPAGVEQLGVNVRHMTKPFDSERIDSILAEIRAARAPS